MQYSLRGYLNAVRLRSEKTLLVEGPSDQKMLGRLRHDVADKNKNGQIDATEILSDRDEEAFVGKGSREKIMAIIAALEADHRLEQIVRGKLGTLVDREWDGVTVGREIVDDWQPPQQRSPNFVTRGHSMENYFFSKSSFRAYLIHSCPEHLSDAFLEAVEIRFPQMVALAFAWSISIRNLRAIKRAGGFSSAYIFWERERYTLLPHVLDFLLHRGVDVPENFLAETEKLKEQYLTSFAHEHPGVWLCHGHLGEEVLWACVANLATEFGLPGAVPDRIEKADKNGRHRYLCDHLAREIDERHVPLKTAVEWLHN